MLQVLYRLAGGGQPLEHHCVATHFPLEASDVVGTARHNASSRHTCFLAHACNMQALVSLNLEEP